MGLFGTGLFDAALSGQWNEGSVCGLNKECKDAKRTIQTVCAPLRGQYGENLYQSCITQAQREPRPQSAEAVLCANPSNAYNYFGVICEGYTPEEGPKTAGSITIGNRKINVLYLLTFVIIVAIIFILYKRVKG